MAVLKEDKTMTPMRPDSMVPMEMPDIFDDVPQSAARVTMVEKIEEGVEWRDAKGTLSRDVEDKTPSAPSLDQVGDDKSSSDSDSSLAFRRIKTPKLAPVVAMGDDPGIISKSPVKHSVSVSIEIKGEQVEMVDRFISEDEAHSSVSL
jgi:hypothetical protein